MTRLLCTIALAGFACVASAQAEEPGAPAKTFAGQEEIVAMLQPHANAARSFDDVTVGAHAISSRSESSVAASGASDIPEPQTFALLLAGLGAIVFVAVRRRGA